MLNCIARSRLSSVLHLPKVTLPENSYGQFFKDYSHPAARGAPFRPEIQNYKLMRLDKFLKMCLVYLGYVCFYRMFHPFFQLQYPFLPYPADLIIHNSLWVKE